MENIYLFVYFFKSGGGRTRRQQERRRLCAQGERSWGVATMISAMKWRTISAVLVVSLLASADAVDVSREVARRRRVRAGKSGTRPGDLGGGRAGALQAWSSEGDRQVVEVQSVAALEVSASIEPVTAMLLVTGVVHLVSAGINAYRHHHASNFVASMRDVQEQIVSESLARCVQARTTVFQVRLFDTAVGVYAAHASGLAASSPDAAGRLSELSANFNTLKRDLAPILHSMSGAACNADPQAARRLHDHAKAVEANEENLKKIAKSVVQELTGALLAGVSLAIPLAVEGFRHGAGQSALAAGGHGSHSPVERIIATFTDGKGDLFSDLTETLDHFAHLAEFTAETHHQVVKICQTTIEGYVRSTFQNNVVGSFLNGARTLVALSATIAHLIGAAAGAALTTAATSLGLAVAVWTLGSSVRAGLRGERRVQPPADLVQGECGRARRSRRLQAVFGGGRCTRCRFPPACANE